MKNLKQMNPTEYLKSIVNERYTNEDGERFSINLKAGLDEEEITAFEYRLPGKLPTEIRALLEFSSGFEFYIFNVTFTGSGDFGFEELVRNPIMLTDDGSGNFWVLEVSDNGIWGKVYYVCHDPPVLVKHSENLTQFLQHLHDYGQNWSKSHFDIIYEHTVWKLDKESNYLTLEDAMNSKDDELIAFTSKLAGDFLIADLRGKPLGSGFEWGKFMKGKGSNIIRHKTLEIWAFMKPKPFGVLIWLKKLFGRHTKEESNT